MNPRNVHLQCPHTTASLSKCLPIAIRLVLRDDAPTRYRTVIGEQRPALELRRSGNDSTPGGSVKRDFVVGLQDTEQLLSTAFLHRMSLSSSA